MPVQLPITMFIDKINMSNEEVLVKTEFLDNQHYISK